MDSWLGAVRRALRAPRTPLVRAIALVCAALVVAGAVQLIAGYRPSQAHVDAGARPVGTNVPGPDPGAPAATTAPPTTASTSAPATTTTAPPVPPTTAAPPPPAPPTTATPAPTLPAVVAAAARPALADGGGPYRGFGAWVDVYDWTSTYTNGKPSVGPADMDRMADLGVQTVYIQAARGDADDDVVERQRLLSIIAEAHRRHLAVVAWYLPYLTTPDDDLRHLRAIAALPIEGLAVDIEARNVTDVAERNRRLVDLSAAVSQLTKLPLAAIVLPPVVLEVVNTNYWPDFPWRELTPFYDLWMPMSYWTNRTQSSGYRDAYRYTTENIRRMRADLGLPQAVVHPIGGIGDNTTTDDIDGFVKAVMDTQSIGGSLYDYATTGDDLWSGLAHLRAS